jgi:ATP-binding cassette subfamily C (CFTR/MRP) protein 1
MRTGEYKVKGITVDPDRKILFTPTPSQDDLHSRADRMEMLAGQFDQAGIDGQAGIEGDALQLTAQLTRASTGRTRHGDIVPPRKQGAAEEKSTPSRPALTDLVARYGKRTAKKIRAGRYAVENDKVYNMSLWRAIYQTSRREFWKSASLLFVACTSLQSDRNRID